MSAIVRFQGAPVAEVRPVIGMVTAPQASAPANDAGPARRNILVARRERRNRLANRNS